MTKGRIWALVGLCLVISAIAVATTLIVASPVALQPNAAPWWGIPLFTLAGGVGGAVITGFFLVRNENRRWARQARAETAQLVRNTSAEVLAFARQKLIAVQPNSWTLEQEQQMWGAITRLTMVAPTQISQSASELGDEITDLYDNRRTEWIRHRDSKVYEAKSGALIMAVMDEYQPKAKA